MAFDPLATHSVFGTALFILILFFRFIFNLGDVPAFIVKEFVPEEKEDASRNKLQPALWTSYDAALRASTAVPPAKKQTYSFAAQTEPKTSRYTYADPARPASPPPRPPPTVEQAPIFSARSILYSADSGSQQVTMPTVPLSIFQHENRRTPVPLRIRSESPPPPAISLPIFRHGAEGAASPSLSFSMLRHDNRPPHSQRNRSQSPPVSRPLSVFQHENRRTPPPQRIRAESPPPAISLPIFRHGKEDGAASPSLSFSMLRHDNRPPNSPQRNRPQSPPPVPQSQVLYSNRPKSPPPVSRSQVLYSAQRPERPALRSADSAIPFGSAQPAQPAALRGATPAARAATGASVDGSSTFAENSRSGGRVVGGGGSGSAFGGSAGGGSSGDGFTDRAQLYESIRQIARQGAAAAVASPQPKAGGGYAPSNRAPPRSDVARWSGGTAATYAAAPPAAGVNIACV